MFGELDTELRKYVERGTGAHLKIDDPFNRIREQIKHVLGIVFASFQSYITLYDLQISNAYALMGTFGGSVQGKDTVMLLWQMILVFYICEERYSFFHGQ